MRCVGIIWIKTASQKFTIGARSVSQAPPDQFLPSAPSAVSLGGLR